MYKDLEASELTSMDLMASMALLACKDSAVSLATKLASTEFKASTVSNPSMDLTALTVLRLVSEDLTDLPATKLTSRASMDLMAYKASEVSKDSMECKASVVSADFVELK